MFSVTIYMCMYAGYHVHVHVYFLLSGMLPCTQTVACGNIPISVLGSTMNYFDSTPILHKI